MHLYVLARGIKDHQDRWVNDLLARYLPCKTTKENEEKLGMKEGQKTIAQLSVRPVQLYEIVFPEDQLDEVLKTVKPKAYTPPLFNGIFKMMRGMLKLDKIPKWKDDDNFRVLNRSVSVHGIGIKKDNYIDGVEML